MIDRIIAAPEVGARMPNFKCKSSQGNRVQINDFRHRCNLVIALIPEVESDAISRLLDELARRMGDLAFEDANVLAIVEGEPEVAIQLQRRRKLPFPLLSKEDGSDAIQVGAESAGGAALVYVLDRYGQIYAAEHLSDEATPKAAEEVVDELVQWLQFINLQCPECGVPEWPTT